MDRFFATYDRRITVVSVLIVLLGAPLWIGQIKVGNLLMTMKTTEDLFKLTEGSIISAMFATRFMAAYLSGAFTLKNLLLAIIDSLRFAEILWLICVVYLATMHPLNPLHKALRWSALSLFALQGILYVFVFYALYSAYNTGNANTATALLSALGFALVSFSLIEAWMATLSALSALFTMFHKENS
ncbi:MAG: hypothetical protein WBL80_02210 [Erysipelotrichaceae bacterium]